jgi:hypothetical protein
VRTHDLRLLAYVLAFFACTVAHYAPSVYWGYLPAALGVLVAERVHTVQR